MNEKCTQKVDFENPTSDLVIGLPGYYRPIDWVKQLEMVRDRFRHNDRLKENPILENRQTLAKKKYIEHKEKRQVAFDEKRYQNELHFMKDKFENRPFDIISGNIKQTQI